MALSSAPSRRAFLLAAASSAAPALAQEDGTLTAGQIIERIKANVGVPWAEKTVDKIVAGEAQTAVKGIATTMMATFDVIQRAAKDGKNLVITHEPTFYSHLDGVEDLAKDETYAFKADFIRRYDIVVFRFHDHWHRCRPDGIATGMARELGWDKYAPSDNPRQFDLPQTTLAKLAKHIESKLGAATVRVVGDPRLPVKRVRANWGYAGAAPGFPAFSAPGADVLIIGETREWELVEYAQDAIASGKKQGLFVIGHVASEQAGMKYCAEWLKTFISEVPIGLVASAEPFWNPTHPPA